MHELENVVRAAQLELTEAVAKERNLQELLDATKAEAFEVNKRQIEFDRIKREADNNQRLYDMVLKRLKDTELSGMLRTSNARVLDAARPNPAPIRPKVRNNLVLGLLLGLLGGLGLAFALEQLDTTVKSQSDVEERSAFRSSVCSRVSYWSAMLPPASTTSTSIAIPNRRSPRHAEQSGPICSSCHRTDRCGQCWSRPVVRAKARARP